jgi:hypothetical protein
MSRRHPVGGAAGSSFTEEAIRMLSAESSECLRGSSGRFWPFTWGDRCRLLSEGVSAVLGVCFLARSSWSGGAMNRRAASGRTRGRVQARGCQLATAPELSAGGACPRSPRVISAAVSVSLGTTARSLVRFHRVLGPAIVMAAIGLPWSPSTGTPIA